MSLWVAWVISVQITSVQSDSASLSKPPRPLSLYSINQIPFALCSLLSPSCGLSTYDCWQYIQMITERKEKLLRFHSVPAKPGQIPDAEGFSFLGKTKESSAHRQNEAQAKSLERFSQFSHFLSSLCTATNHITAREKLLNGYLPSLKCSISINYYSQWHSLHLMDKHAWARGCCLFSFLLYSQC